MNNIVDINHLGIDFIKIIQHYKSDNLTIVMKYISFMGNEEVYLILIPVITWVIHFKNGTRLATMLLLSAYITFVLKDLIQAPHPFDFNHEILLIEVSGNGSEFAFPSGHALNTIVVWGLLASFVDRKLFLAFSGIIVFIIGYSRIYLGVHFPTDIIAGWLFGGIILGGYFKIEPWLEKKLSKTKLHYKILIVILFSTLMSFYFTNETSMIIAGFLGMGIGMSLSSAYNIDNIPQNFWGKVSSVFWGLLITALIYIGLKKIFPQANEPYFMVFNFIRYLFVGIWVMFGAILTAHVLKTKYRIICRNL